jgi:hypothetical protein
MLTVNIKREKKILLPLLSFVAFLGITNEDHNIEDLQDRLKPYQKVASTRFVNAVCKQAINYHLICAKHSPLLVLSAPFVGSFTEQEFGCIEGDDIQLVRTGNKI